MDLNLQVTSHVQAMAVFFWIIISDASSISDKSSILAWATQNITEEVMVREEVSYSMVAKK